MDVRSQLNVLRRVAAKISENKLPSMARVKEELKGSARVSYIITLAVLKKKVIERKEFNVCTQTGDLVNFLHLFPRSRSRLADLDAVSGISVSTHSAHGPSGSSSFAIPYQTNSRKHINKELGRIVLRADAEFTRGVVIWVLVVPVVPSFATCTPGNNGVLGGVRLRLVRMVAHQVSCAVDQPGEVQYDAIPKPTSDEEGIPKFLAPVVARDLGRHNVAHVQGEPRIESLLELNDRIFGQVREVHVTSGLDNGWMLLDEEPSHVSKEKATHGVVRISVSLTELMVNAVITRPVVDAALVGN